MYIIYVYIHCPALKNMFITLFHEQGNGINPYIGNVVGFNLVNREKILYMKYYEN